MIPRVEQAHVAEAIGRILRDGVPRRRRSRGHCVVAEGVHLPPKYVVSVAHEVATGEPLPWNRFHGGRMSNEFVGQRGFEVIPCRCGGTGRLGGALGAPRTPLTRTSLRVSPPFNRHRPKQGRLADTQCFYELLDRLARRIGGPRCLRECDGRMEWPERGIYFFFESGEARSGSGAGPRVVRVGTHAVTAGSGTTLWSRLKQHRGNARTLDGRHRSSIFRGLVGEALARRDDGVPPTSWRCPGVSKSLGKSRLRVRAVAEAERVLEQRVSRYIGAMPFLWLDIGDVPSPGSARSLIESNAIALLSGVVEQQPDPPSATWLGYAVDRPGHRVPRSGLWNQQYTETGYDDSFLEIMEDWILRMRSA
jgi:hypothetical protein